MARPRPRRPHRNVCRIIRVASLWAQAPGILLLPGNCRIFLTDAAFREHYGTGGPIVIWLNLDGREAVVALYEEWSARSAQIVAPPEAKPWGLHEFTAVDVDGNRLRVFYDFATPEREAR